MTERELLAIMAASIWPHVNDSNRTITDYAIAVDAAQRLLGEVNARQPIEERLVVAKREVFTSGNQIDDFDAGT